MDRLKVKKMMKKGAKNAEMIAVLKKNSDKVLITLLIWNDLINVLASSFATAVVISFFPDESAIGLAVGIATGIMTFLLLVFGDIVPKRIAIKHSETVMSIMAPAIGAALGIFGPIILFVEKFSSIVIRLMGIATDEKKMTQDEVKSAISLGEEEGAINAQEKEMIHRIFRLDDIPVEEIMTSRTEIAAVDESKSLDEISGFLSKASFSRLPVYRKDIDHITGILYAKDALRQLAKGMGKARVSRLMDKVYFVPKTKKIDKLLREFQERKHHMAIVVDEYGITQGVVTLDDVMEEIVGDIEEGDGGDEKSIRKIGDKKYIADGNATVMELNEMVGANFSIKECDTVTGMIMAKTGKVPKKGEVTRIDYLEFTVSRTEGPKIEEVVIFDKR